MSLLTHPLLDVLPEPAQLRARLVDTLREVRLLRGLLRLCERADQYRRAERHEPRSRPTTARS